MPDTAKQPKFLHFAAVGYAVIVFQQEADAVAAQAALREGRHGADDTPLFLATNVIAEIEERNSRLTALETIGIGFESESMEQFLQMAREGCSFITVYASTEAEQAAIRTCVEDYKPRLFRHFGAFTIDDLATSTTAHNQSN